MTDYNHILKEYQNLREAGLQPKEILRRLGTVIKPLPQAMKEALAAEIRSYEGGAVPSDEGGNAPFAPSSGDLTPRDTNPKPLIKPLRPTREKASRDLDKTFCWQCGKPNRIKEVICVHCGAVLRRGEDAATKQLDDDNEHPEHYGPNSTLLMRMRDANEEIQLRPQESKHEVIVGRVDAKGVVTPDVDLSKYNAAQLGVSRMHMSVIYDDENELLRVTDMGSSNGVFINGQRLVTRETRVLRNGDQLRLGELVINVFYQSAP